MTCIVADTTSGLAPATAKRLGFSLIPQIINFGQESFREGVDIDNATFMTRLRTGRELPKTAAPYPGDFIAVFEQLTKSGGSIVCIHPSVEVSGTVRSAMTAREAFPGADIRVIDTRSIASPLATMVLEADKQAKAGASADQIETLVAGMIPRARVYFLVDTLEFLQRGGRIGGAAALVGSILQIKPILALTNGHVEPLEKERTKKRALARIQELVLHEAGRGEDSYLTVMHSAAPDEAAALAVALKTALGASEVTVMDLVPAVATHVGPGALAVGFFVPA
jgi:DegV family protein with EDD domain